MDEGDFIAEKCVEEGQEIAVEGTDEEWLLPDDVSFGNVLGNAVKEVGVRVEGEKEWVVHPQGAQMEEMEN